MTNEEIHNLFMLLSKAIRQERLTIKDISTDSFKMGACVHLYDTLDYDEDSSIQLNIMNG